ncbi:MAG: nucleotide exchange factor GrpE [Verrucomicrobia bacterium]|nr:nucleotide exchange factor GrpE [Verrucomicrobiota bacterium]
MFRSKKTKHNDSESQPDAQVTAAAGAVAAPTQVGTTQPAVPSAPSVPPMTPAEIEKLKADAAQAAEWKDKCFRVAADLDNFRKRAAREKIETSKYATQQLLARLLPTIDNFEAALQHADAAAGPATVNSLIDGLKMTLAQLHTVLRDTGVEVVNAEGQHFDPQVHEAVQHIESDTHPAGRVIQQLRKGYKLSDRLLRPATVVVSKGKPELPDPAPAEKPGDANPATQPGTN